MNQAKVRQTNQWSRTKAMISDWNEREKERKRRKGNEKKERGERKSAVVGTCLFTMTIASGNEKI